MIAEEDFDFYGKDWREHPWFRTNVALEYYDRISGRIDGFVESLGYRHEGSRFFCERTDGETVALFSHGGSGACALGHLLALPFPYVCAVLPYDFTSISILNFPDEPGKYVYPRVELFNDCAHIHVRKDGPAVQQKPDDAARA